jgi:hypothetical protein
MGTRSLTYVYETHQDEHTPVMCLYRQYDGYMEGHGLELAQFLTRGQLVNGLGGRDNGTVFNGMGCLAAQMVAHFKTEAGQFYLYAPVLNQDACQDFEYHVFRDKVVVYSVGSNNDNVVFDGTWAEFYTTCKRKEELYLARVAANKD